jgi:hypothetical protein
MGNNTENTEALIIEEAREERTSVRLGVLVLAAPFFAWWPVVLVLERRACASLNYSPRTLREG